MTETEIGLLLDKQKSYFATGATLPVDNRLAALKRLKDAIVRYTDEINAALKTDLGKSNFEGYMCETGLSLSELSYMLKHTRRFAKERRVPTDLVQFAAKSFVKPSPYGTVLIMSPWNYPFLLTIDPLIDAIAAGNTAVIKPSAYSPATSSIIAKIIGECFAPEYVAVVTGGRAENSCLLKQPFDYILFTGSQAVGREVMKLAAEHLTPVTLELGGKSPCIIDASANLKLTARRLVFGKYLNCGQTCVAPDYVYCPKDMEKDLITAIKKEMRRQFGETPLQNENYGKIINQKHYERICGLINADRNKVVIGGIENADTLQIEPTVLADVTWNDAVMQEEIFGPVMPVLTYQNLDEVIAAVNARPHPLALYIFAQDKKVIQKVTSRCSFGGGCVNDTIVHLATSHMGFGGVGASGMGSYHGKCGFDTFSHHKSILDKKQWIDLPMRYQPYTGLYEKMLKMFLR